MDFLPLPEFVYNNTMHSSTKQAQGLCSSQSEDRSQFSHCRLRMAFPTEYTNKKTINQDELSKIGSIQNYCLSQSSYLSS